jgi:DNA polymerase-1
MPIGQIHDALYFIWKDSLEITKFVNDNLIKAMNWQELPEIQHDTVKLEAELLIYSPSWADPIKIKNNASFNEIKKACSKGKI